MVAPVPAQISKLPPRLPASSLRRRSHASILIPRTLTPFLLITYIQTKQFHELTDSFAQRRAAIPFSFKDLRTLSIATGVYPSIIPDYTLSGFQPVNSFVYKSLVPLCRLFALFSALVSFVFNRLQPLFRKHPGVGYPRSNLQAQSFRFRLSDAPVLRESPPSTFVLRRLEPILYPQSYCPCAPLPATLTFASGGFPLNGSERRTTQRFQMRLPLTVRWTTGAAVGETSTESRDVSSRGVYFFLAKDVKEGSAVEILLTLPNEITLAGPVRVRCLGRVQRTEPRDQGAIGVVAAIERYEFLRGEEDKQ
jgi:hypothetical protein